MCVVEATGQEILDALELGVMNYPLEDGGFQHVSGLTFSIDVSIPSSVALDETGAFAGVTGAYRATDVMVNGEPLDLNRTYTVASHNLYDQGRRQRLQHVHGQYAHPGLHHAG